MALCTAVSLGDAKHSTPYDPKTKHRDICHLGQRKLYLSELQLLTLVVPTLASSLVVVYAGAAPGTHIPLLAEKLPTIQWHLYDPAPFCHSLSSSSSSSSSS